jgi:hypothetical protein
MSHPRTFSGADTRPTHDLSTNSESARGSSLSRPETAQPAPTMTERLAKREERGRTYRVAVAEGPAAVRRWHEAVQLEDAAERQRKTDHDESVRRAWDAQRVREARARESEEEGDRRRAWNAARMREARARAKAARPHLPALRPGRPEPPVRGSSPALGREASIYAPPTGRFL